MEFAIGLILLLISLPLMIRPSTSSVRGWPVFLAIGGFYFAYKWNGLLGLAVFFGIYIAEFMVIRMIVQNNIKRKENDNI